MEDYLSKTATRLRTLVPEVLNRWEAQVLREVQAARTLDPKELRDHLHVLLEQVVRALSPPTPEEARSRLTTSERHGGERALLESYTLGDVLHEYSILRRMVLTVLEEGGAMLPEERAIINDALEQALMGASTQYALVQRRADRAEVRVARAETATLLEVDQNKTRFLAWLGHELRTPLSALSTALSVLEALKIQDERAVRQIGVARRQTRLLARLADDLLDLSRISQGTLELRTDRLDLRQPVWDASEASKTLLDERLHTFECRVPESPVWVRGDAVRLVQAFTNLLNNAARYSPKGSEVRLSLEPGPEEAVVRVADTGIGIDPAMLEQIFEPFVQLNRAGASERNGLGIGLSLLLRIVEMHGGTVTAQSRGLGQGSEFIVRLPVLRD